MENHYKLATIYLTTLFYMIFSSLVFNVGMKVQKRTIGNYQQLYITLPAKICEAMNIEKGAEVKVSVLERIACC